MSILIDENTKVLIQGITGSFGALVTTDHIIVGEKNESRRNDTVSPTMM